MPSKVWNDINLPGFSQSKEEEVERERVTGVEDSSPDEEPEDEVRIVSAEWFPGSKGFQYNEQCFVDVSAEYLVETNRARITGNLFGIYDGVEVDMGLTVSGCIDDSTMVARIAIPKLYFINNDHYTAWQEDKSVPCQYVLKGITHTRGANSIDSPVLDMPNDETAELKTFSVTLKLDPDDPDYQKFKFILYSTDDERSFEQVKTIRDDIVKNNDTTELLFTDLDENLTYTLEKDAGNGDPPTIMFRNRAYARWAGAADGLAEDAKPSGPEKGGYFSKASGTKDMEPKSANSSKSGFKDNIAKAKDLKNRADETATSVKSQVNDVKQGASQTVNNAKSQVDNLKKQAESTANLKDKLTAINATREKAQKAATAKEKVANAADVLKSVPTFKI